MPDMSIKFKTVEEYISVFPPKVKKVLRDLRRTIKENAPGAKEVISYNMPAFKFHGILVYYAAHKEHIGFYPGNASTIEMFKEELEEYKTSKGTVQFPFDKPLPLTLIKKIVMLRIQQNLEKEEMKKKGSK